MTIFILRDRQSGRYEIASDIRDQGDYVEADVIPWRVARKILEADTYAFACRTAFDGWCKDRGL